MRLRWHQRTQADLRGVIRLIIPRDRIALYKKMVGVRVGEEMAEAASDYRVALCIREVDGTDLNRCVAIIGAGGAVDVDSTKLRAARALALARNGDEIVGIGSVKPVRTGYAAGIAKKSGFDFPPETPELGYVAVDVAHRKKNLSHRLVAELLRGEKGRLFATTDDRFMKRTLSAAGFVEKGREWKGRRGQLSLWVRNPANGEAGPASGIASDLNAVLPKLQQSE